MKEARRNLVEKLTKGKIAQSIKAVAEKGLKSLLLKPLGYKGQLRITTIFELLNNYIIYISTNNKRKLADVTQIVVHCNKKELHKRSIHSQIRKTS